MLLAFELSGEHSSIPESEVLACLESLNADFQIHLELNGCLIIDLEDSIDVRVLSNRLSMTHNIIEVLSISGLGEEGMLNAVKSAPFDLEGTYSIRVRRIKDYDYAGINTSLLERRIGEIFYRRGYRADLRKPEKQFRVLISGDKSIFGIIAAKVDRGIFESRKPHYKPFFYPGVLMPRLARALVNMAKPGKCLLDPFCGTGGILVEAGLMGIKVIGGDAQRKLLLGAKMNLEYYNINHSLMYQDACNTALRDESVDAIVTDPPYGRSAMVRAESLEDLIACSLKEIHRVLKKGSRAVFISSHDVTDIAKKAGFKVAEIHLYRVHRSLTRHIYVLEK